MDSGSTARSSHDFQAESLCRFGEPGIVSERVTAINPTLDCGKFLISLGGIHMFHPACGPTNGPACEQGFLFRCPAAPAVKTAPLPFFSAHDEIRPQWMRSTYRLTVRKCSSSCVGKDLKRPC